MRSFPCLDHQIVECYSTYSQKSMFENRPKSRNQQFEYVQYLAHVIITMRTICYCFVNRSKLGRVNELIPQLCLQFYGPFWRLFENLKFMLNSDTRQVICVKNAKIQNATF